jgi:hypothetical protein
MASPAVWADVRSRLEAADLGGVPIAWPNEGFFEPGSTFVSVRIRAAFGVPIELGQAATWQEEGDVFCTVLVPEGTGITAALTVAEAIVNVFRLATEASAPVVYTGGEVMDAEMEGDSGGYYPVTARVSWKYQNRPDP